MDPKERDGQKENGQTLVTRGTILGIIPNGSSFELKLRGVFLNRNACPEEHTSKRCGLGVQGISPA